MNTNNKDCKIKWHVLEEDSNDLPDPDDLIICTVYWDEDESLGQNSKHKYTCYDIMYDPDRNVWCAQEDAYHTFAIGKTNEEINHLNSIDSTYYGDLIYDYEYSRQHVVAWTYFPKPYMKEE